MDFTKILRLAFLIMMIFISQNTMSQYSKSHYIPPITTTGNGAANPLDQYLYISTPSETPVNVVIKPMGGSDITGTVSNSNPWDNLKFDIDGIAEVQRKFFGTLYNT